MSNIFLLGTNKSIDTSKQVVEVNQIIRMEGYGYDSYVVYSITKNDWGINYGLINLRTKEFRTTDIIQPLKEEFGIGYYYDSEDPQFMDSFEVAMLLQEAQAQQKQEEDEQGKITPPNKPTGANGKKTGKNGCTMVEYSAKSVAVFGDTKTIKEELKAMGGKFNARLTINGEKLAGWVFSKAQEQRLACYFELD